MSIIARLTKYDDPNSLGARFRKKRSEKVKTLVEKIYRENGNCRILDVGGEAAYWRTFDPNFLESNNVHVSLSNINPEVGTASGLDLARFSFDVGDACALPYEDNSFDLVHSNSVIEHVGDWMRMSAFARQVRRLAPRYYVQMPYFWFPFEPHFGTPFFHWLPESMRVSLIMRRSLGQYPRADSISRAVEWVQSARLLDRKQFSYLFPDATIFSEKFAGLPKSLIAIRDPAPGHSEQ